MKTRIGMVLIGCALVLGACGDDTETLETGQASLQWHVGARGCDASGTPAVRVTIADGWTNTDGVGSWVFDCGVGRAVIPALAAGRYNFVLEALTTEGSAEYVGETGLVEVRPGGVETVGSVILAAAPAELTMQWTFGGPLCAQVDVQQIEVLAFDEHGSVESEQFSTCEVGGMELRLEPGAYAISVAALDEQGAIRYMAVVDVELGRGDRRIEQVTLSAVN